MSIKTISVIRMDNNYIGLIKYFSSDWHGVAYRIPRTELENGNCDNIDELKNSGIYFLFGMGNKANKKDVYIGQSGNILKRLKEHKEKKYWIEAISFIGTSSQPFGSSKLDWLENHFYMIAKNADNYNVKSNITPPPGNLTEMEKIEFEIIAENIKILLGGMEKTVFELTDNKMDANKNQIIYSHIPYEELKKIANKRGITYKITKDKKINLMFLIMALKDADKRENAENEQNH